MANINEISIKDKYLCNAMDYLVANQNKDGLMSYTKKEDMSCIDSTAQYILGAFKIQDILKIPKYKKSVLKAVSGLSNCAKESYWGTTRISRPIVSSTAFALLALHAAKFIYTDSKELENKILQGINRLLNIRNIDGGWGIYEGDESKSATTALALLAINTCFPDEIDLKREVLHEAREFIIKSQLDDGSWNDVIERDAGFTVIRFSAPYCISALIETGCSIDDIHFQKGFSWLLKQFQKGFVPYKDSGVVTWSTRDGIIALCSIRDSLDHSQLLQLIDFNIRLEYDKQCIINSLKDLQQKFDTYIVSEDKRIAECVHEKFKNIKNILNFYRVALSVLVLLFFLSVLYILSIKFNLDKDQLLAFGGIEAGMWGTITALIFSRGTGE